MKVEAVWQKLFMVSNTKLLIGAGLVLTKLDFQCTDLASFHLKIIFKISCSRDELDLKDLDSAKYLNLVHPVCQQDFLERLWG